MEHPRAFITAWLSIYLLMLKRVCRRVSFHHTVCFSIRCAVTVVGLATLHHSHCSLLDPPVVLHLLPKILQEGHLLDSPFSAVVILLLFHLSFPFLPYTSPSHPFLSSSPSSPLQCQLIMGGWGKGSTKASSGPPTDPVPPFTEPSFLAISPVLVFWLGPRPLRHKGLIMGYNWLGCVTHLCYSTLPVPPFPPLLFVFGLLLKNWASQEYWSARQTVSLSLSLYDVTVAYLTWLALKTQKHIRLSPTLIKNYILALLTPIVFHVQSWLRISVPFLQPSNKKTASKDVHI